MSEAEREEAYLSKVLNRGKGEAGAKKVFGGGLEAARAREDRGINPKPVITTHQPVVTHTHASYGGGSTAQYNKPPPGRTHNPPPQRWGSLEAEVVEIPSRSHWEPSSHDESSIALNSGVSREEAARREEERLGKNIGKFAIAPREPGSAPPPPPSQGGYGGGYGGSQPKTTTTAGPRSSGGGPSYGGSHSQQTHYNPPPPSHGGGYGGHNPAQSHSNVSHGHDYTYPDFQIGTITPVDNNTTVLPLSPFGCNAHELALHVRQNGKQLEVKRMVTQKGAPRNEIKNINLPFQVFPHTTTASYNANKNGGELAIFFGKAQSNTGGESEVGRFTVYADPSSSETRVAIGVSQSPDSFLFRPERPCMYDTDFTVVLSGSVLEFRSVTIFEDDEGTKTVNAKQTVNLPITPGFDQIEANGDNITVYVNSRSSEGGNVADFQVHISPGH